MKIKFSLVLFVLALSPISISAKAWRDLIPLHSTKTDIELRLGKPIRADNRWMIYEFPSEDVSFFLTDIENCGKDEALPKGTIIYVEVIPRTPRSLSEFGIEGNKAKKFEPSEDYLRGFTGYFDDENGLVVRTDQQLIDAIYFVGTAPERSRCPYYYPNPKILADIPLCFLCPTFSVSSPDEAEAGSVVAFTAGIGVGYPRPTTIKWTVSAGAIISGQGTPYIEVSTSKAEGKEITGTIEVQGWDRTCGNKASTTTKITNRKNN